MIRWKRWTEFTIVHQVEEIEATKKAKQKEVTEYEQRRLNDGPECCVRTG